MAVGMRKVWDKGPYLKARVHGAGKKIPAIEIAVVKIQPGGANPYKLLEKIMRVVERANGLDDSELSNAGGAGGSLRLARSQPPASEKMALPSERKKCL